ncbi:hypothetical protein D9V84_10190 [Bacteroidetes/Chlorobi group bacterium Naka2016]|nr:MAG: hypothetical protein D9V84_10190 [Bacteroidetes/Chlorobi group bacterium Naka2016]
MIEDFKYQGRRQAIINTITRCFPNLPPCDPPPPPNYTVEARESRCMYYENFLFNKFTGSEEWLWVLRPCDNLINACSYTYQLCIDYSLPEPQVKILYEECTPYEPPGCSEQYPELPPPGKTWEEPWRTECFSRPCCPK